MVALRVTMDTDNAQSTQVPANGTPDVPGNNAQTGASPGVQERINELTAKFHAAQEQSQQQAAMTQELMAQNTRLMEQLAARNAPESQLPPLPEGADPSLVDAISARVQAPLMAQIKQLEQSLKQTVGSVAGNQEQLAMQAAVANEAPAVQKRALELYHEAKQKGYGGWTPYNLTMMARGMVGVPAARANAPDMMGGGAPTPSVNPRPTVARKSEAELRQMTSDQRIAYYDSLVGDAEIMY